MWTQIEYSDILGFGAEHHNAMKKSEQNQKNMFTRLHTHSHSYLFILAMSVHCFRFSLPWLWGNLRHHFAAGADKQPHLAAVYSNATV